MSSWVIWFIGEAIKLLVERLKNMGSLETLTEEQAKAEIQRLTDSLPTQLPSPEDLEGPVPQN